MNASDPRPTRGAIALIAVLLVALVFAAYGRVGGNGFVNLDDPSYVTHNEVVRAGLTRGGVVWAFTRSHSANWHPLTWLSHMLDIELFGIEGPGGHHLVSTSLHAASAVLLLLFVVSTTGRLWASALVAGLFALHPQRVESVAWVSERKDVLSGLFFFLTLLAWARYARRPGPRPLALVAAALLGGLLSKQMLVTLPAVLVLVDVWPLRRWRGTAHEGGATLAALVREKLPLIGIAILASAVAVVAQRTGGTVGSLDALPLWVRFVNAVAAYGTYLWQTLWPVGLACFYPHPALVPVHPAMTLFVPAAVSAVVLAGLTLLAWRRVATAPWVLVGWLWFLGTLVPVIGLVQIGSQSHADRYAYLPLVGIYLALVFSGDALVRARPALRTPTAVVAGAALALLGWQTWRQVGVWRSSETLARHALAVTQHNYFAQNNLGLELLQRGDYEEAEGHLREALAINPGFREARFNLGVTLEGLERDAEAATQYELLLRTNPDDPVALRRMAGLHAEAGDPEAAIADLERGVAADPTDVGSWLQLARLYLDAGNAVAGEEAASRALAEDPRSVRALILGGLAAQALGEPALTLERFRHAAELAPDDPDVLARLGRALANAGALDEARPYLERSTALDPERVGPLVDLAKLDLMGGERDAARARLERALALDPASAEANDAMGFLDLQEERKDEAERRFLAALEADPDSVRTRNNLGYLYESSGRPAEAVEQYRLALAADLDHPSAPTAARGLAWILATSPDEALRDGPEAVRWADFALDAGNPQDARAWEVLAAAHAAASSFERAQEAQARAIELVRNARRREAMEERLDQYRRGIPWRRSP